ncbi:MAG: methyl-accepting chemotaxis protein, partial [Caulobacteraceae bacterium]
TLISSADAAKEIKVLINASDKQVNDGVQLVGRAGQALQRIASQVVEINGIVVGIATAAEEQATALQEVNTAVNQMDQMTQQNAAMVEESNAATSDLSSEAEKMGELMSLFQLGQTGKPAPSNKPRRVAAPDKPARQAQPKLMRAVGGGRSAAPADTWEEF